MTKMYEMHTNSIKIFLREREKQKQNPNVDGKRSSHETNDYKPTLRMKVSSEIIS